MLPKIERVDGRPVLIDLYCGAGGAGAGYRRASAPLPSGAGATTLTHPGGGGFRVIGVDINPQKNYVGNGGDMFIQADVRDVTPEWLRANADAVHASPPCQFGTKLRHAHNAKPHVNLIPFTRSLLEAANPDGLLPWVIENVDSDKVREFMPGATMYCGTAFHLGTEGFELQRHRLFMNSVGWDLPPAPCHHRGKPVIGIYGGHARNRSKAHGGRGTKDVWKGGHKLAASSAMGIDWMTLGELSEAIPPDYTQRIGDALMAHLISSVWPEKREHYQVARAKHRINNPIIDVRSSEGAQ